MDLENLSYKVSTSRGFLPIFWSKEKEGKEYNIFELADYMGIYLQNEKWETLFLKKNLFGQAVYLFQAVPHPKSEIAKQKIKLPDYMWVKIKRE
ncbi:hypothetical protein GW932_02530 [archaeon]|nr:hypothetical protein [archaeon]